MSEVKVKIRDGAPRSCGISKDSRPNTNIRIDAERIAGHASGKVTRQNTWKTPAPDIRADSSRPASIEVNEGAMMR